MRFTTIDQSLEAGSQIASKSEISRPFSDHRMELTWLAEFLSDDALIASVCVADACGLMDVINNDEFCEQHSKWEPMVAIVLSVLELKSGRIAELAPAYECSSALSPENLSLPLEMLQLVITESDLVQSRLDCLCRFVLVWCGFAQNSISDAALLLGISGRAVEAAYASALETLEVIYCQAILETGDCAAA